MVKIKIYFKIIELTKIIEKKSYYRLKISLTLRIIIKIIKKKLKIYKIFFKNFLKKKKVEIRLKIKITKI
jgi:hypothetical protein